MTSSLVLSPEFVDLRSVAAHCTGTNNNKSLSVRHPFKPLVIVAIATVLYLLPLGTVTNTLFESNVL